MDPLGLNFVNTRADRQICSQTADIKNRKSTFCAHDVGPIDTNGGSALLRRDHQGSETGIVDGGAALSGAPSLRRVAAPPKLGPRARVGLRSERLEVTGILDMFAEPGLK